MAGRSARVVVLDRDGVINEDSDDYIRSPGEWRPLPGALAAIARLSDAGFTVAVATNQSGIGRGLFDETTLAAIHAKMLDAVTAAGGRLTAIYYCPHTPAAGCACRKPAPGLLLRAAAEAGVAPESLTFIGDKRTDVEAALAAGARPILVGSGDYGAGKGPEGMTRFTDLAAAVDSLLGEEHEAR